MINDNDMTNEAIERLTRWIRPSTQPVYLRLEHPCQDDMAFAADVIISLSKKLAIAEHDRDSYRTTANDMAERAISAEDGIVATDQNPIKNS